MHMSKKVILTGLRANNDLHLGNYLGALLPIVNMATKKAGDYQINLFVPDLHSFTTPVDHTKLNEQIMQNLRVFVAAGLPLDNPDIHLYRQSYIPAHSEMTVILNSFTGMGMLERMTQFKDKSGVREFELLDMELEKQFRTITQKHKLVNSETGKESIELNEIIEKSKSDALDLLVLLSKGMNTREARRASMLSTSVGLFDYPVLMAADILLYNTSFVPVGEDQSQHLEFTRDIAQHINKKFGDIFTVPVDVKKQHAFFNKEQGLRIRDLQDPAKKMSKSSVSDKGVIFLTDSPESATKKVMSAETDNLANIQHDYNKQPGISSLLDIYQHLGGDSKEFIGKTQYGDFKKAVAVKVEEFLTEFQAKLGTVNDDEIISKLETSEVTLSKIAAETLTKVQKAVGLR
jgi:tryptophanyl-tRNA synthetase